MTGLALWLATALGGVLAVGIAFLAGHLRGRKAGVEHEQLGAAQTKIDSAAVEASTAKAALKVAEQLAKLAPGAPQRVADAPPDTAAGKLAQRWQRKP